MPDVRAVEMFVGFTHALRAAGLAIDRAQDFVAFLREIDASVEPALDIHVGAVICFGFAAIAAAVSAMVMAPPALNGPGPRRQSKPERAP